MITFYQIWGGIGMLVMAMLLVLWNVGRKLEPIEDGEERDERIEDLARRTRP